MMAAAEEPVSRTNFPSADVVTFATSNRICGAIFKNPTTKCTHFYRYRLKGSGDNDDCPLQIRNIGAAIRLWGRYFNSISNIKISEVRAAEIEEPSKWLSKLEEQQQDCQNKYGCRISLQDFEFISAIEKRVFSDLSKKILESCISEDDLIYFNGQDDSNLMSRQYFDV